MLSEITGAQLGLLLEVQKAWVREMAQIRMGWRLRRIVKQVLNIKPGQRVLENTFICEYCRRRVPAVAPGARPRSHCPHCLWSLHVQHEPASRGTTCRGLMEPVEVSTQSSGAWSLVHHCRQCHATQVNSIAVDDNGAALLTIAARRAKAAVVPTKQGVGT